jgi:hypothetical protein
MLYRIRINDLYTVARKVQSPRVDPSVHHRPMRIEAEWKSYRLYVVYRLKSIRGGLNMFVSRPSTWPNYGLLRRYGQHKREQGSSSSTHRRGQCAFMGVPNTAYKCLAAIAVRTRARHIIITPPACRCPAARLHSGRPAWCALTRSVFVSCKVCNE